MREPLSLHQALYRRQKALIARALEGPSPAFARYQARYRRRTRSYARVLAHGDAVARALAADVVHVGDYHTLPQAQRAYLALVEAARAGGRRVVLGLECLESRHQALLDAYLAGRLAERSFFSRLERECPGGLATWPSFRALLGQARAAGLQAVALDLPSRGPRSLAQRDRHAAERIVEAARADDRPQVLVLVGQFHVAPCHLPREVERARAAAGAPALAQQVVYQNCEGVWWSLAREGLAGRTAAVELADGALCLVNASPVACQQSFLDYLDAAAAGAGGDVLGEEAPERFRDLARRIGRGVGVRVEAGLERLEVVSTADVEFERRLRERGRFSAREAAALKRHVLARESAYVPRARLAILSSCSLRHAAEEAAHFVRHCAAGAAMEAERSGPERFYARLWEEALAHVGARLVDPDRRAEDVPAWARAFREERGERRDVAAFVLAHKGAERQGPEEALLALLPPEGSRLEDPVAHALGYLLGDALFEAHDAGHVSRAELRALFHEPLARPAGLYLAWTRRLAALPAPGTPAAAPPVASSSAA
jgi:hypothetical protein